MLKSFFYLKIIYNLFVKISLPVSSTYWSDFLYAKKTEAICSSDNESFEELLLLMLCFSKRRALLWLLSHRWTHSSNPKNKDCFCNSRSFYFHSRQTFKNSKRSFLRERSNILISKFQECRPIVFRYED